MSGWVGGSGWMWFRSGRGWGGGLEGWGLVEGGWLVAMLGVGGDAGYGGCEPRI